MTHNTSASRTKRLRTMIGRGLHHETIEETNERPYGVGVLMIAFRDLAGTPAPLDERGPIRTCGANGVDERGRVPGCHDPAKLFAFDRTGEVGLAVSDGNQRPPGGENV